MNYGDALIVLDNTNLQRLTSSGRADEHGDGWIVGLEGSPMVSNCVQHVVVGDSVLAGCRLDVHNSSLERLPHAVNIC